MTKLLSLLLLLASHTNATPFDIPSSHWTKMGGSDIWVIRAENDSIGGDSESYHILAVRRIGEQLALGQIFYPSLTDCYPFRDGVIDKGELNLNGKLVQVNSKCMADGVSVTDLTTPSEAASSLKILASGEKISFNSWIYNSNGFQEVIDNIFPLASVTDWHTHNNMSYAFTDDSEFRLLASIGFNDDNGKDIVFTTVGNPSVCSIEYSLQIMVFHFNSQPIQVRYNCYDQDGKRYLNFSPHTYDGFDFIIKELKTASNTVIIESDSRLSGSYWKSEISAVGFNQHWDSLKPAL